jgi:hypothetical protein
VLIYMPTSAEDEYTEGYNKQRKGRDDPDLIVTIGSSQIHLNSYLSLSELPSGFKLNYRIITDTSTLLLNHSLLKVEVVLKLFKLPSW